MKVYLLWFNECPANYVLGIFESKEQAELWKSYFISNPIDEGWVAPGMKHFLEKEIDWIARFDIVEYEIGKLDPEIKVDNLKYLENLVTQNEKTKGS